MTGTSTSIWPDQNQLARITNAFPGRQFRYLPGNPNPITGVVETYYGIVEGDPGDAEERELLGRVAAECGDLAVILVLGGPDWQPPA